MGTQGHRTITVSGGPDVAVRIAQALKATQREQARVRFLAEAVEADRSAQRAGDTRREHQPGWEGCPYLGLPAYEERHALIFYGRRAMTPSPAWSWWWTSWRSCSRSPPTPPNTGDS